ncbi:MAG TPA: hypothetical protein VLD19_17145 [Chitinophagaceae bacterium]|nr:hypothetical protein [Chitinophagaceae bacterium]
MNIDSDEHIYIRQANGSEKRILPDSTFGFITNGIQYVYIPREKRYLAVLNDKAPVFLLIKEKYIPFKGIDFVDDSLLYTRNLGMPLKACTMSNIRQDFGDNPELVNQFSLLLKAIIKKGFDGEVHRKSFLKYRQLIRQYLGAAAS